MRTNALLFAAASLLVASSSTFVACTGDDTNTSNPSDASTAADSTSTTPDTGTPGNPDTGTVTTPDTGTGSETGGGNPAPPALGTLVDRMARPAINTALNHAFDGNATTAGAAKDAYNADTDAGGWVPAYSGQFAANLAILDSLDKGALANDGGGCGNQPYADPDAGADRYKTLSSVLAADMLWLNTASTTCSQYLAVELNATNVMANTDCGGRALPYDVIQTTYSIVSGVGLTGFGSGVSAVAAKTNGTTFPYLAAPQ
ncbi:MAG TPA: hypothetical protein VGI39_43065 [Polyangiaceae bacterium]|jgi:hypothetical protein